MKIICNCPSCINGQLVTGYDDEEPFCLQCSYTKPLEPLPTINPIVIPADLPPLPEIPNTGGKHGATRGKIIRSYLEENSELVELHCLEMGTSKVKNILQVGNIIWYDWAERHGLVKEKVEVY